MKNCAFFDEFFIFEIRMLLRIFPSCDNLPMIVANCVIVCRIAKKNTVLTSCNVLPDTNKSIGFSWDFDFAKIELGVRELWVKITSHCQNLNIFKLSATFAYHQKFLFVDFEAENARNL